MDRQVAIDRIENLVATVESETMPVPVREIWVYGDVAIGKDPLDRLDIYLTKDILMGDEPEDQPSFDGVKGIGQTIRASWAKNNPDLIRTNESGYAAPEKCLAAHLIHTQEPVHLEVCNTGFEDNVTQRLQGAIERNAFEEIIDPRGVCLWIDGTKSDDAFEKLRSGELVFPTLPEALEMLGADEETANEAASVLTARREDQTTESVRGDVI